MTPRHIFDDVMDPGIDLIPVTVEGEALLVPDYLRVEAVTRISLSGKLDPANLPASAAIIYDKDDDENQRNLYLTDEKGNIAFFDCMLVSTANTAAIRSAHPEYHSVGGKNASHKHMDAGHFGLSLGQHPSIAMEQDSTMNRYGIWRVFERYWKEMSEENSGNPVHIIGVFVEGDDDGTYSPFWCIREESSDGDGYEYIFTNDDEQW